MSGPAEQRNIRGNVIKPHSVEPSEPISDQYLNVSAGSTIGDEPDDPENGQIWIDTSESPPTVQFYDSSTGVWFPIDAGNHVTVSEDEPEDAFKGDVWFDQSTADVEVNYFDGAEWITLDSVDSDMVNVWSSEGTEGWSEDFNTNSYTFTEDDGNVILVAGDDSDSIATVWYSANAYNFEDYDVLEATYKWEGGDNMHIGVTEDGDDVRDGESLSVKSVDEDEMVTKQFPIEEAEFTGYIGVTLEGIGVNPNEGSIEIEELVLL